VVLGVMLQTMGHMLQHLMESRCSGEETTPLSNLTMQNLTVIQSALTKR